mgnify:CR=1 FL=1
MGCLGASYFIDKIKREDINNDVVIVSPDTFGVTRARKFKEILDLYGIKASFGFVAEFVDNQKNDN